MGGTQNMAPGLQDLLRKPMMNGFWSKKINAGMPMLFVVPLEKALAKSSCIFNATKTLREIRPVLEGLELRLGKRVIITCVGPAVRLGDAKIGEEQGHRP